jgi:hypothetical protein
MDSQFDSLKREATKLERNLEDKVARYQQVSEVQSSDSTVFEKITGPSVVKGVGESQRRRENERKLEMNGGVQPKKCLLLMQ